MSARAMVVVASAIVVLSAGSAGAAARQPDFGRLEEELSQLSRTGSLSGVVLVARSGKPVFTRAYGYANRATSERNRRDTQFSLASVGKTFTAVAVAQLVQAGRLAFNDKLGRYVPEVAPATRAVTIAQLLAHTSGLGDFFAHPDYERLEPTLATLERYLPLIRDGVPAFPPGTRFAYSNSGYVLLGLVIERVSGVNYYTYLERNVFAPAKMSRSGCFLKSARVVGRAVNYVASGAVETGTPARGSSAGGCYSTAPDLLRFADALIGNRLINQRMVRVLTTTKTRARGSAYGFGFVIRSGMPGDPPTVGHSGGTPGAGAELAINRGRRYTVVLLANVGYRRVVPAVDLVLNTVGIP